MTRVQVSRISELDEVAIAHLLEESLSQGFGLTLRTNTLACDRFYQRLGFKTVPAWAHTTHHLQLSDVELLSNQLTLRSFIYF